MSDEEIDTDEETRGAPAGNTNAQKHGLFADEEKYFQNLSNKEKQVVIEIAMDLAERVESDPIGAYEREAIRNIALDMVKRRKANEWMMANSFDFDKTTRHEVYSRLLRDMTHEMEKLGLHVDNPEQNKADAEADWFRAMEEAAEEDEEEDETIEV